MLQPKPHEHEGKMLQACIKAKHLSISGLAKALDFTRPRIYRLFEREDIPADLKQKISESTGLSELDLFGNAAPLSLLKDNRKGQHGSDLVLLNRTTDTTRDWQINKHGNRFEPLSDGTWRVYHKHVPIAAHASYVAGWGDPEYTETLPEHSTIVTEVSNNLFVSFTVTGSCQDDGTIEGIRENMELAGESYPRSMWQYKLPFVPAIPEKKEMKVKAGDKEVELPTKGKRYRYWIIVDRYHGVQVAMIKGQDVEKGILHCCCRNPDKKSYPDFDINLDDCSQIFFVIKRVMND